MPTSRLEAFSDGVLAIIITIMVLELRPPEGATLTDLWRSTGTGLLTYLLSFVYVGIYWNNHHHLLHSVRGVTGGALWANLHLLFWLSLLPFATGWMDGSHFARLPVVAYGVVLLAAALAYTLLQWALLRSDPQGDEVRRALGAGASGAGRKEKTSIALYLGGIVAGLLDGVALPHPWGCLLGLACYVAVALIWLVPDRRLEPAAR